MIGPFPCVARSVGTCIMTYWQWVNLFFTPFCKTFSMPRIHVESVHVPSLVYTGHIRQWIHWTQIVTVRICNRKYLYNRKKPIMSLSNSLKKITVGHNDSYMNTSVFILGAQLSRWRLFYSQLWLSNNSTPSLSFALLKLSTKPIHSSNTSATAHIRSCLYPKCCTTIIMWVIIINWWLFQRTKKN